MGLLALMMPIPNTGGAPFFVAAAMMMGMGAMATIAGWSLHLITGVVVGAIFGILVAKVSALHPLTSVLATGLGALAGILVWLAFFMPMMVMLMPSLTSMPMLIGGSLFAHLAFGLVLGAVTSVSVPKVSALLKCETCAYAFSTREALDQHGNAHMSQPMASSPTSKQQAPKCSVCGMTFESQKELTEHSKQAHPMPAP